MSQMSGGPPQAQPSAESALGSIRALLIIVAILQIAGWIGLVLVLRPGLVPHRMSERQMEVVREYGAPRVQGPEHLVVTSETRVYVNGERVAYRPEDETDAVEYGANILAADRGATVLIRRTIIVRAGPAGWSR